MFLMCQDRLGIKLLNFDVPSDGSGNPTQSTNCIFMRSVMKCVESVVIRTHISNQLETKLSNAGAPQIH